RPRCSRKPPKMRGSTTPTGYAVCNWMRVLSMREILKHFYVLDLPCSARVCPYGVLRDNPAEKLTAYGGLLLRGYETFGQLSGGTESHAEPDFKALLRAGAFLFDQGLEPGQARVPCGADPFDPRIQLFQRLRPERITLLASRLLDGHQP